MSENKNKICKNKILNKLSRLPILKQALVDIKYPPNELKSLCISLDKTPLKNKINVNDILVFQYVCMFISFSLGITLFILDKKKLINLNLGLILGISYIFLFLGLNFRHIVKFKVSNIEKKMVNSIPIINNYILNMTKQDKPIADILYNLTNVNTPYKENFIYAYELYNKNQNESFNYLIETFQEEYIKETFKLLKKSIEYDKYILIDSLSKINNILKRNYTNTLKIRADKNLVNNELSMVVPFLLLGILIAIPISETVFYYMRNLNNIY